MPGYAHTAADQDRARVLTTAALNVARELGLSQAQLARILGISESTVSRMASGRYLLKEDRSEWQLAALLVRLFRSLDALMAGDEQAMQSWLRSPNSALGDTPEALIQRIPGLTRTVDYVDAYRARV